MQIQVGKLKETLGLFKSVVQKSPSVKSLRHVWMGDGVIRATDLEVGVEVDCPEAVEKALLPYHLAVQWLKYVPGDEMLTVTAKESGGVDLAWSGGQTSYPTEKVDDYPPVGEVKPKLEADVDGDALVRAMLSVAGYAASDKSRPVLTGVCLILGDPVGVAASDGFRMAWRDVARVAIPPAEEVKEVIIPSGTVGVLAELMAGTPRTAVTAGGGGNFGAMMVSGRRMHLVLGETQFRAQFGPVSFTGRLIKGNFPNYKALIPAEPPNQVRVFAPDMERAVKGLAAVVRDASGIVRMVWKTGGMSLSGGGEGVGKTSSLIPSEVVKGNPDRVAIGIDKLLGYLKDKQGMVTMCVTSRSSPVLFRSALPPEVLLMPMGVRWEDEEQKTAEKPATGSTGAAQGVEQAQAVQPEQAEDTAEPRSEAVAGAEQVAGQSPKPAKESAKPKRVVRVKGSKKSHAEKLQRSLRNEAKGAS